MMCSTQINGSLAEVYLAEADNASPNTIGYNDFIASRETEPMKDLLCLTLVHRVSLEKVLD